MTTRRKYEDLSDRELNHTGDLLPGQNREGLKMLCGRPWKPVTIWDHADTIAGMTGWGKLRRCRKCMASDKFELLVLAWIDVE